MIIKEIEAIEYNCHYPDATNCVGSRCMAWRWALVGVVRTADDKFHPANEWIEREPSTTHGYCGLAGRP